MTDSRTSRIVEVLTHAFGDLAAADPVAVRRKYRKMAAEPFAFYRGSAPLFYADAADRDDPWADERTSRVWIQGDLHVENFGTYMDGSGHLVFDVNDFDEAYLGHVSWDLQRLATSIALMGWTKAIADDDITALIAGCLRGYLDQVEHFADRDRDHEWSLHLGNATGAVHAALVQAQRSTRIAQLDRDTVVDGHQRRFREGPGVRRLDDDERAAVERAYDAYLETVPASERLGSLTYRLKDVVGRSGFGIGSAGLPAFNLLVEGHTEALENDVVLSMKQGNVAAPSRVVDDPRCREAFQHHGHRTALSQRALQAHSDPWLGWTQMEGGPLDGVGLVVQELSPYEADLDWGDLTEPDEMAEVLEQLGRATAKVHCVSDVDHDTPLVDFQVEDAVLDVVGGREDDLVEHLVGRAHEDAAAVRADHARFVDAFRSGLL